METIGISDVTELFDAVFDTVDLGVKVAPGGLTKEDLPIFIMSLPILVQDWLSALKDIKSVPSELSHMDKPTQEALILHISQKVGGLVTRPSIINFINSTLSAIKANWTAFQDFKTMKTDLDKGPVSA